MTISQFFFQILELRSIRVFWQSDNWPGIILRQQALGG